MAKFQKGNPGGPGRPKRATEILYLDKLTEIVTPERWAAIVEKAVTEAEAGNPKSREWLAGYLVGKGGWDSPRLSNLDNIERNQKLFGGV